MAMALVRIFNMSQFTSKWVWSHHNTDFRS